MWFHQHPSRLRLLSARPAISPLQTSPGNSAHFWKPGLVNQSLLGSGKTGLPGRPSHWLAWGNGRGHRSPCGQRKEVRSEAKLQPPGEAWPRGRRRRGGGGARDGAGRPRAGSSAVGRPAAGDRGRAERNTRLVGEIGAWPVGDGAGPWGPERGAQGAAGMDRPSAPGWPAAWPLAPEQWGWRPGQRSPPYLVQPTRGGPRARPRTRCRRRARPGPPGRALLLATRWLRARAGAPCFPFTRGPRRRQARPPALRPSAPRMKLAWRGADVSPAGVRPRICPGVKPSWPFLGSSQVTPQGGEHELSPSSACSGAVLAARSILPPPSEPSPPL